MVDTSGKFRWLVRLGFAARGLVYVLIGYIALTASRADPGPEGALGWLQDVPLGTPLLYLSALGLLGYALFRLCSLLFDVENYGSDGSGLVHRIGHGFSGLAHLALAWTALQLARQQGQPSTDGAETAAATLLSLPLGSMLLGLGGIGFVAAAALQAKSAVTAGFMRGVAADAPGFVEPLGRAGHAARAVVFLIIGWSLVQSAWFDSSARVKTLGEAVSSLADQGPLYVLVAAGLLLFGVFSLFLARYRIVPDLDPRGLVPGALR
jgi:hypothetical protein